MSSGTPIPDPVQPFVEFWTDYAEQSGAQTNKLLEGLMASGDPKQLHRRWLDTVSRSLDSFMRSPVFLEALGHNLKAMADLKALQDRLVQQIASHVGVPLASDITGLFERLHSVERAILARLTTMEARLKTIETKLESVPGGTANQSNPG